jgi:threonine synthase
MGFVEGLRCGEFGRKYDVSPISVCEFGFGALEVMHRSDEIKERLTVEKIMRKPKTMWRNDP